MRALGTILSGSVLILSSSALVFPNDGSTLADIPVTIRHHQMWLEATINEKGPFLFVLDTGSQVSTLDRSLADRLELLTRGNFQIGGAGEGRMRATEAIGVRLGIGRFTSRELTVQVVNLRLLQSGTDERKRFEGIIGTDVLRGLVVDMDYPMKRLRLHLHRPRLEDRADWLPVENGAHLRVHAVLKLKGLEPLAGRFAIDTGAAFGVIVSRPFAQKTGLDEKSREFPRKRVGRGIGGDLRHRVTKLEHLTIGPFAVEKIRLAVPNDRSGALAGDHFDGLIGGELWERFRVVIDMADFSIALLDTPPRGSGP